jgi:predicted AlkP superfamily pyrophosphatase or phosphodiesterase
MEKVDSIPTTIIITFLLMLIIVSSPAYSADIQLEDDGNYVIIISIDGFPADALWDERIPLTTIRSLANNGAWSSHFVASTPTVTWPNHTTIATGVFPEKHGVLTNGRFIRSEEGVSRISDLNRSDLTSHPAIYDYAYEAGLITAEVNWPVTRNAETLHFSLPDAPDAIRHSTPQLIQELINAEILKDDTDESFRIGGALPRDEIWTATAEHLIINHKPNILLFHLLNVDGTHHQYGEGTSPGLTALTLADTQVKRIVDALEKSGIKDRSTIFIVSDHGFMNVNKQVHPNILLKEEGLIEVDEDGNVVNAKVQAISNGGTAMVFAHNPETKEEDLERAYYVLSEAEGILNVLKPDDYSDYGLPNPSYNENMGHLLLNADQHFSFGNSVSGYNHTVEFDETRGTHGYLSDVPEMKTIFVASGRGIRSGIEWDRIDNRSVAPTAAHLLGFDMEEADGEILWPIIID